MADNTLTAVQSVSQIGNAVSNHSGAYPVQWSFTNSTASALTNNDNGSLTASVILLGIPVQTGTTVLAIHQAMSTSVSALAINFGFSGDATNKFGSLTGQAAAGFLTSKNLPYTLSLSDDAADPRVGWITAAGFDGKGGAVSITAWLTRDPT